MPGGMKSTEGQHYLALDQLRGIAAYLVVMWHFLHSASGLAAPVPYEGAPLLAIVDEGHTGVALFMALSGYLFAKLCDGRRVQYGAFIANRALRLFPLLFAMFAFIGIISQMKFGTGAAFLVTVVKGFVLPVWPHGGWSVAAELQFYLVLPLLLLAQARWRGFLVACILASLALRTGIWLVQGTVQPAAYWTIIGRFDQFALGILAWLCRDRIAAFSHWLPAIVLGFMAYFWWFDWMGGFRAFSGLGYPNRSAVWIVQPTIEGIAYAVIITQCDRRHGPGLPVPPAFGNLLAAAGTYSYSIYLLHFFAVDLVAMSLHRNVLDLSNFWVALPFGTLFFVAMIGVGRIAYRCVEAPFLRYRMPYLGERRAVVPAIA